MNSVPIEHLDPPTLLSWESKHRRHKSHVTRRHEGSEEIRTMPSCNNVSSTRQRRPDSRLRATRSTSAFAWQTSVTCSLRCSEGGAARHAQSHHAESYTMGTIRCLLVTFALSRRRRHCLRNRAGRAAPGRREAVGSLHAPESGLYQREPGAIPRTAVETSYTLVPAVRNSVEKPAPPNAMFAACSAISNTPR